MGTRPKDGGNQERLRFRTEVWRQTDRQTDSDSDTDADAHTHTH